MLFGLLLKPRGSEVVHSFPLGNLDQVLQNNDPPLSLKHCCSNLSPNDQHYTSKYHEN